MSCPSYDIRPFLQPRKVLKDWVSKYTGVFIPTVSRQGRTQISQQRTSGASGVRANLGSNNVVVLGSVAPEVNFHTDGLPLRPCRTHPYKATAILESTASHQLSNITNSNTLIYHNQGQAGRVITTTPTMSVTNNSNENSHQDANVLPVDVPRTPEDTQTFYETTSIAETATTDSPTTASDDVTTVDEQMVTRSRAHQLEEEEEELNSDYLSEQTPAPPPKKPAQANPPAQQHFHYSASDRFKSLHIYNCLKHPDHVRFHLNNWEQRQRIDVLAENTDEPTGDNDLVPADAEYVVVAEEMISAPHFGSALFFASKHAATDRFTLHVGFYYSFDRMPHNTSLPSLKLWADEACADAFPVLQKSEVLRAYGVCWPRFVELYARCGKAVDAEFRDRYAGNKWAVWLGPRRRRALRRKRMVLDQ